MSENQEVQSRIFDEMPELKGWQCEVFEDEIRQVDVSVKIPEFFLSKLPDEMRYDDNVFKIMRDEISDELQSRSDENDFGFSGVTVSGQLENNIVFDASFICTKTDRQKLEDTVLEVVVSIWNKFDWNQDFIPY